MSRVYHRGKAARVEYSPLLGDRSGGRGEPSPALLVCSRVLLRAALKSAVGLLYRLVPQPTTMTKAWTKFVLLMWKNWVLQKRHKIQTTMEILVPVLFTAFIVLIRSLVDPVTHTDNTVFYPFDPIVNDSLSANISRFCIAWSPNNIKLSKIMNETVARLPDNLATCPYNSEEDLLEDITSPSNTEMRLILAGVVFDESSITNSTADLPPNLIMKLRFPGELQENFPNINPRSNWKTNLLFPLFQTAGPRSSDLNFGGPPGYYVELFLALQAAISNSLIDFHNIPNVKIQLQRYPYPDYIDDPMLLVLQSFVSLIILLSFVYTCISIVKVVTTEKEKQLKESMKMMGLPNWLHWLAWFLKTLMFLLISVVLIVILFKIKWYKDSDMAVFTYADGTVLFVFMVLYMITSICFCFMISVFFSKANTAATVAGLAWFLSYSPYLFMQQDYENLSLGSKIAACLASNTAMSYGFQLFIMFEGTGAGVQWDNIWTPSSIDDDFMLGYVIIMFIVDSAIYMMIALYVEAVFPGEFGVPKPWYFFVQKSYWCGVSAAKLTNTMKVENASLTSSVYEKEPNQLNAGIQIKNLCKVFNKDKAAVNNLSVNMYEGQITVLLGHNGAGKTTTMSMLTGLFTPTSGTALVGGHDICSDIDGVRDSLGLCPQHNVLFDELTVREHLYFFGKLKGLNGDHLEKEIVKYIRLLELEPKENSRSVTLSGGMKRKLSAGVALCGDSKVVMFDEPTSGMDPSARRAMWDLLQGEKHGRTMLLTTHFMDEADLLGDRIAIMAGGELQCCGSSFFLKKKYGAGYRLVIVKGARCNVDAVTRLLQRYIPNLEVTQNIGSELSYLLNESQSSIFEAMLHKLEESKNTLGILSYGVSLTTMEEVFMRVGKDLEVSMENGNYNKGNINVAYTPVQDDNTDMFLVETKVHIQTNYRLTGMDLIINQLHAMLMKKALYNIRSWLLFLIQILIPVFFLIIVIIVAKTMAGTKDLPALNLDLEAYDNTYTLVARENDVNMTSIYKSYKSIIPYVLEDLGLSGNSSEKVMDSILKTTKEKTALVRQKYIVGASFQQDGVIGWFSNEPYHGPPIALNLIINSILKNKDESLSLSVINHPLPFTQQSQVTLQMDGNNLGFQIAFNVGFSMAFVSAFFVLFNVKERATKAKHLQFVSGVEVLTFWVTALAWDGLMFLVPALSIIITMAAFQEEGFSSPAELGRVFTMLVCFGWAMLPLIYLLSFIFTIPASGYIVITMISIFTGVATFLVVTVLQTPALDLEDVAKILDWILMVVPHYSLSSSLRNMDTNRVLLGICTKVRPYCHPPYRPNQCCKETNYCDGNCLDYFDNYFEWDSPGIGRNIFYFLVTGAVFIIILLLLEFRVFERLHYFGKSFFVPKVGSVEEPDESEDYDVSCEKTKLRTEDINILTKEYNLVMKNVTKYYGNFLAVNQLCAAVKEGECFGLLGVNGAGKTSTFKMLTGDEKISLGEAYVNGISLKTNMKKVHQLIGYCPQFDALIEDLTGRETLYMFCLLRGIPRSECSQIVDSLANELLFTKHINKRVKAYSGGNKRKLSTAVALIGDPPVIYLDEPTTGMDPVAKRHLWNVICKVRDSGKCIILTSHSMEECEALCTRLAIMVNGNFKCLGSTQHLKNRFAEGYTLTVKVKKSLTEIDSISVTSLEPDSSDLMPVKNFINTNFRGAVLREEHQSLLTYYIPTSELTWSKMFGMMERAKTQLNIEDYSLGQTSLEQVFLSFTKIQRE